MTPQGIKPLTFRELPACSAVSQPNGPPRTADKEERHFYYMDIQSQQTLRPVYVQ